MDRQKTGEALPKLMCLTFEARFKNMSREERISKILGEQDPSPLRPHKIKKKKIILVVGNLKKPKV